MITAPLQSTAQQKHDKRYSEIHSASLSTCIIICNSHCSLTREHSFSTASSISSWCPILWTPNASRSWEVSWSRSTPDRCHCATGYWCSGVSKPCRRAQKTTGFSCTHGKSITGKVHILIKSRACAGLKMVFFFFSTTCWVIKFEKVKTWLWNTSTTRLLISEHYSGTKVIPVLCVLTVLLTVY